MVQLLQFSGGYIVEDELAAEQQEELKKEIEKKKREDYQQLHLKVYVLGVNIEMMMTIVLD